MVFSPNGKILLMGTTNEISKVGVIVLWDTRTGTPIRELKSYNDSLTSVALSSDGRTVASGSYGKTIHIWNALTGKQIGELKGHTKGITCVAFSPDGLTIASGSDDKTVRVWDVKTKKELFLLKGHTNSITSVVFSPDGITIASGSDDKSMRLWDGKTGKCLQEFLTDPQNHVNSVAFSPQGTRIVSGMSNGTACLWECTEDGGEWTKTREESAWELFKKYYPLRIVSALETTGSHDTQTTVDVPSSKPS
ncbi:WD40 repeat domain-containing protein [Candidatus Dependentiae bacterium]|nr:WD40 repeat domain-containing protein [Candidatus Dependentiae bacterium]